MVSVYGQVLHSACSEPIGRLLSFHNKRIGPAWTMNIYTVHPSLSYVGLVRERCRVMSAAHSRPLKKSSEENMDRMFENTSQWGCARTKSMNNRLSKWQLPYCRPLVAAQCIINSPTFVLAQSAATQFVLAPPSAVPRSLRLLSAKHVLPYATGLAVRNTHR